MAHALTRDREVGVSLLGVTFDPQQEVKGELGRVGKTVRPFHCATHTGSEVSNLYGQCGAVWCFFVDDQSALIGMWVWPGSFWSFENFE